MVDSGVQYIIEQFDYEHATHQDTAEIGAVYDHCFTNDLNLVFDPSLDADFVDPCRYYSKASGGAFFVVRRVVIGGAAGGNLDDADQEQKEVPESTRKPIVGTLGVRNFTFESEERWVAFQEGIKANTNSCDAERAFASSCVVKNGGSGVVVDSPPAVSISYPSNESSSLTPLRVCELKRMFFLPECRGRQLGKQQVAVALEWASSSAGGYNYCILDTKRRLEAANHVYEKYGGFVECGSYNGNPRADKFMCKLLLPQIAQKQQ